MTLDIGSMELAVGLGRIASIDNCEDMVLFELLLCLLLVALVRSWLCRRAKGTGGGTRFCECRTSDVLGVSLILGSTGAGWCCVMFCVLI